MGQMWTKLTAGASKEDEKQKSENNNKQQQTVNSTGKEDEKQKSENNNKQQQTVNSTGKEDEKQKSEINNKQQQTVNSTGKEDEKQKSENNNKQQQTVNSTGKEDEKQKSEINNKQQQTVNSTGKEDEKQKSENNNKQQQTVNSTGKEDEKQKSEINNKQQQTVNSTGKEDEKQKSENNNKQQQTFNSTGKEDEKQKSENNNKQQPPVKPRKSLEKISELILIKLQAIDSIEHSGLHKLSSDQRIYFKDRKKHLEEKLDKILQIYSATGNRKGWSDLKIKQTEYYEHKKVKLMSQHEEASEAAMRKRAVKQLLAESLPVTETKKRVYCSDLMDATLCMHAKYEYDPNCDKCTNRRADYEDRKKRLDVLFKSLSRAKLQEPSKPATVTAPWEQEWSPPSYYPQPRQPEFGCYQLFPSVNSDVPAGPIARPVNRVEPGPQTQEKLQETSKPATVTAPWEQEWSPPSYYPQPRQPEFGCYQLSPSDPSLPSLSFSKPDVVNSDVPAGPIARPVNRVEPGQQTQDAMTCFVEPPIGNLSADDVTRSVPTVVTQSEEEAETNASSMAREPEQEDDDRELDLEVERYTTKSQAEEANASVEPATLQQNMSTPSGQNVDDDVSRSVPTVVVQNEMEVETNASTMAREREQEDDEDQSSHPEEPSKDDA